MFKEGDILVCTDSSGQMTSRGDIEELLISNGKYTVLETVGDLVVLEVGTFDETRFIKLSDLRSGRIDSILS